MRSGSFTTIYVNDNFFKIFLQLSSKGFNFIILHISTYHDGMKIILTNVGLLLKLVYQDMKVNMQKNIFMVNNNSFPVNIFHQNDCMLIQAYTERSFEELL